MNEIIGPFLPLTLFAILIIPLAIYLFKLYSRKTIERVNNEGGDLIHNIDPELDDTVNKIKSWSYFFIFASILNIFFLIDSSNSTSWGIPLSFLVFPILLVSYIIFWIKSISAYNRIEKDLKTSTKYIIELLINSPILLYFGGFLVLVV